MGWLRRTWTRRLIAAVGVIAVLVIGGPFVYIHFIEGKAPAPLRLSTSPTTAPVAAAGGPAAEAGATGTSGAVSSPEGNWQVSAGSTAGYRIKETLFGQSNTAVGRTSTITGSITVSGSEVTAGRFSVDMTTVKSDQSQRDHQFEGRIMETSTFPTATFELTKPILTGALPAVGTTITATASGKLTLHGTTNTVTFSIQARRNSSTISVSGLIPIVFSDYGISNPSGGPATTSSSGTMEFLLNFAKS